MKTVEDDTDVLFNVTVVVPRSLFEDELGDQGYRPTPERLDSLVSATEEAIRQDPLVADSTIVNLQDHILSVTMAALDMLVENGVFDEAEAEEVANG